MNGAGWRRSFLGAVPCSYGVIIIGPATPSQIAAPKPQPAPVPPQLDWIDQRILDLVHECEPVKLWAILNLVSHQLSPRNRDEGREVRMKLWHKVRRLIGLGLLFRIGRNSITTLKPATKSPGRSRRRRSRIVKKANPTNPVSRVMPPSQPEPGNKTCQPRAEVFVSNHNSKQTSWTGAVTESVSDAARQLARLPRNEPRKLTGWLHGQHCWRGRLLILPDGEIAPLLWCSRGRVLLRNYREMELPDYLRWGGRRERDVLFFKSPEATLLGSRKRGTRERPSALKSASARRNGAMPVRRGRRGRPSRTPYLLELR